MFSQTTYVFRLVVLQHIIFLDSTFVDNRTRLLKEYCRLHLRANISSSFDELQYLRKRTKAIGASYYVHPTINWWSSREGLCYRDMSIPLTRLFSAVQTVLSATEALMISDLMFSADGQPELDRYDPERIATEDMNWRPVRQSFVNFEENHLQDGHRRVLARAQRSSRGSTLFASRNFSEFFCISQVEQYSCKFTFCANYLIAQFN